MTSRADSPSSRDKILDVAEALFARRGFAGVGMREVAEAAHLGKSSLFHHFKTKAHLYLAVLARVLDRIAERTLPVLGDSRSPLERLDASVDALVDALAEHPTTARLLLRGLFEDDDLPEIAQDESRAVERTLGGILQGVQDLLREGIDSGALRPVSVPHTLQTLIGATVYHFASGKFGEDLLDRPLLSAEAVRQRKQEVKALLRHGLAAPQSPNRGESR
ncbi:MAG: TetR/AcrR family transcriptional regulator [Myxococcota bacterium]